MAIYANIFFNLKKKLTQVGEERPNLLILQTKDGITEHFQSNLQT